MEQKINQIVKDYFKTDDFKIERRLMGGMSNYTYVVNVMDNLYTVRYPGEYCEYFVDRKIEEEGIQLFNSLNLTNQTIYFNNSNHVKIAKYVDGTSLNELKNNNIELPYKEVAELLKKVHQSSLKCTVDYNAYNRLDKYENDLKNLGFILPSRYLELRNYFNDFQEYLESQEKVLCHNDSQPSNFIQSDNKLFIVDFEFVGNNDLIYDIACFANMELSDGEKLLSVYFEELNDDLLKRFYLWRAFQCFQWYNVAMFKELVGMSKTLKLDFKMIAESYLTQIAENLEKVKKINKI